MRIMASMFISFKRIIKASGRSFGRNKGLAIVNIFIMVMMLSVITSLFFFNHISQFLILSIQARVDISAHFRFETLEQDIREIKEKIANMDGVEDVEYVSQEQALKDFIKRHQDDPVLMESLNVLGFNPFLSSLNIRAAGPVYYQAIAKFLETEPIKEFIEKVDYKETKPAIERIFALTANLNRVGIGLVAILAIMAVLIVFNTIRLAIYSSREEIKIQRLVGATNWFIRGPFLVQGMMIGVFAALICLSFFALGSWLISPRLELLLPGLNIFSFFIKNIWLIFLIQISIGIGLGMISSFLATRSYLKV